MSVRAAKPYDDSVALSASTYEIEAYRSGSWKPVCTCFDRQEAVSEAVRLFQGGRVSAVRVQEEKFDDDTSLFSTRTVYTRSKGARSPDQTPSVGKKKPVATAVRFSDTGKRSENRFALRLVLRSAAAVAVIGLGYFALTALQRFAGSAL